MSEHEWSNPADHTEQTAARERFAKILLPHLNAAYNLARWLSRNEHDAQDVVQEAYFRAFRSFSTFHPERDARGWLLAIVRNTFYTWSQKNRLPELPLQDHESVDGPVSGDANPETVLLQKSDSQRVHQALGAIAVDLREVLVLRELEGLSYKQIAHIINIPLGTVMSRLSRARRELRARLCQPAEESKA